MSGTAGPKVQRRLVAIFAADVEGYSRLMGTDEVGTLRTLTSHREVMDRLISDHGGRIANTAGDSVLAEFPSVVDAVQAAIEVQEALRNANEAFPDDRQLRFRIGVHVGDVMVKGGDLFGEGVNIAARLQAIADPGGVCISGDAHRHVRKTLPLHFTDLGAQHVKNIAEPVFAYRIDTGPLRPALDGPRALSKPLPLPDKPSIAVLPFVNMGGDPEQEYFADGVVEDIITALGRVKWFFVIGRNSSFAYKGRVADVRQVGRELGVRYVLEGSIRKAANRVRITGQLLEAATGHQVWSDRFEGDLQEIFELQDRVTENVVAAIEPNLRNAELTRSRAKPPSSLGAYDLYLQALPHFHGLSVEGTREAIRLLSKALELDPQYSLAQALLARCHNHMVIQTWGGEEHREQAVRLARSAIANGGDDPTTLHLCAVVLGLAGFHDIAHGAVERSIAINPNSAQALGASGWVRLYQGESEVALERFRRAIRLSPLDPHSFSHWAGVAWAYFQESRYNEAVEAARTCIGTNPGWLQGLRVLIASLALMGRTAEAQAIAATAPSIIISPAFVAALRRTYPNQNDFTGRLLNGLRQAGVREE